MYDVSILEDALRNSNVRAFLKALRLGEGTLGPDGYRTIVGGQKFDNFSKHPEIRVYIKRYDVWSTAAGAYQIIKPTWLNLVKQYGFKDFSEYSQDLAAIALIRGRKALDDVKNGNFYEAVRKCNKEWASLPGATSGQRTENIEAVKKVYVDSGGEIDE